MTNGLFTSFFMDKAEECRLFDLGGYFDNILGKYRMKLCILKIRLKSTKKSFADTM